VAASDGDDIAHVQSEAHATRWIAETTKGIEELVSRPRRRHLLRGIRNAPVVPIGSIQGTELPIGSSAIASAVFGP
jgi:hypothetical protein